MPYEEGNDEDGEVALIRAYDVAGSIAYELLGYDDDDDEEGDDEDEDEDGADNAEEEDHTDWTAAEKKAFRIRTRIAAAERAEGNRRAGGIKTQQAMVKGWEVCYNSVMTQSFRFVLLS